MSTKAILAIAAAGFISMTAGLSYAKLNGTTVMLACDIASKEFAGPVEVRNATRMTILAGKKITVVVNTATGKESETITLAKDLKPGKIVRGSNTYQNTGGCTASVFYPKVV